MLPVDCREWCSWLATTGAVGPVLIGWLYGRTDAWDVPLLTLLGVALALAILGQLAGADRRRSGPRPTGRVLTGVGKVAAKPHDR